jgi:hypothetical protein
VTKKTFASIRTLWLENRVKEQEAEIERLQASETELTILRSKLRGTLSTTHDCTNRTDCALRKVVWHLRAIL